MLIPSWFVLACRRRARFTSLDLGFAHVSSGLKLKGPKTEDIPEHQTIAGVHVSEVTADQAAETAGLQVSDRILVVNGAITSISFPATFFRSLPQAPSP